MCLYLVCAHVYMASSEPMIGQPLLIGQLHLTCASLYDTLLYQANSADLVLTTLICAGGHIYIRTYENLYIITHRYCSPNVSYSTAIARSLHSILHCSHCLVLCGVCALCALQSRMERTENRNYYTHKNIYTTKK